jgi:hypothetical protein
MSGVILIPYFRAFPVSIHQFMGSLFSWQILVVRFFLCGVLAFASLKLMNPHIRHLCHVTTNPPIWLAWLFALLAVAAIGPTQLLDVRTSGPQATALREVAANLSQRLGAHPLMNR